MERDPSTLPWASLRLIDDGVRNGQVVEVVLDGEPIARLPACRVGYELSLAGRGVLLVGLQVDGTVDLSTIVP